MTPSNLIVPSRGAVLQTPTTNFPQGLTTQPIKVQPKSDYRLRMPVWKTEGRVVIKITDPDTGKTLASATMPDSLPSGAAPGAVTTLQLPFVNTTGEQINFIVANGDSNSGPGAIEVGTIELHRLGPASYLWTKYARVPAKAQQKFFTTGWMLPLALFGVGLLALGRRFDALAIICAVPIYFMVTHAPLHLELRYILPIHYFWAVLVGTSLYFLAMTVWELIRKVKSPRLRT